MEIIILIAGFALIAGLGRTRPRVRHIGGTIFAAIGIVALFDSFLIMGICLLLAGAGLMYGSPLGRNRA